MWDFCEILWGGKVWGSLGKFGKSCKQAVLSPLRIRFFLQASIRSLWTAAIKAEIPLRLLNFISARSGTDSCWRQLLDSFSICWRVELHALAIMAMLVVTVTTAVTAVTAVTATSHSCKLSFALQLGQLKLEHLQPLCWNPLVVVSSLRIQRTLQSGGSVTAAQSSYLQRRWWLLVWTKVPRVQQLWWNRREKRWRNFIFSMSTTGKALRTSPWRILSKLQNCPGGLWWSENSSTARGLTFTMATSWKLWGLIRLRWTCNPSSCMRLVSFKGRISQIQHGPWNGVQILTLIECFHLLLSMQSWLCSKTQTNAVTIGTTNFQREPTGRVPFLFWMLQLRKSLLWMFCMRNHLRKRIPIHGRDNRAAL